MTEQAMGDMDARRALGQATQAAVTGRESGEPATLLESVWGDFVFAEVFSREGLDRRSRLLISIAGAAAERGDTPRLRDYVRGALSGEHITLAELREAALHCAVYCGFSTGEAIDSAVSAVAVALDLPPAPVIPVCDGPWSIAARTQKGSEAFEAVMTFGGPQPTTAYFDAGILNFVFGEMWCREGLDERARRWLTLVGVSNSSMEIPIKTHIYAAMASGNASSAEMDEFVLQYALHAGWPRASFIQGVVLEMAAKVEQGLDFAGRPRGA